MITLKRNPNFPGRYFLIENGKKIKGGSYVKEEAIKLAAAKNRLKKKKMAVKKKVVKRKTTARKSTGIASYTRKIQNSPAVKSADKKVKDLERKLKAAKKLKATKVKAARKKLK